MRAVALLLLLCYFDRISVLTTVVLWLLYYAMEAFVEHHVSRISTWTAMCRLGQLSLADNQGKSVKEQRYMFNV